MPQVTVYIRKDDMPLWEKVEQKTEFVSQALNSMDATVRVKDDKATTPEKSPKKGLCVQHGVDKSVCVMMKH
jgi:hypothetical protein